MTKSLLILFLLVIFFSSFYNVFGIVENVTKDDILELKNQLAELKIKFQSNIDIYEEKLNEIEAKLSSIQESLEVHDSGTMSAFGITWELSSLSSYIGILYGVVIALVVMGFGKLLSIQANKNTAKRLLNRDFYEVNDRILIQITRFRNALQNIGPNGTIVNNLIAQTTDPHNLTLGYILGLFFRTWDANLSRMSDLDEDELARLIQLHDYIRDFNNLPELSVENIVRELEIILANATFPEATKRQMISERLRGEFVARLNLYDRVFHKMHEELAEINWLVLGREHFR